jgi:hypothetical protein
MASVVLLISAALVGGLFFGRSRLTDAMQASVFKSGDSSATLASASGSVASATDAGQARPAVGANATRGSASDVGPLVGQLIGNIPAELREGLQPTPGQLGTYDLAKREGGRTGVPASSAPSAIAPGLLPSLLQERAAASALEESHRAALTRFGRSASSTGIPLRGSESLQASLESSGLLATPFDGGSLSLIRRLEHPVLLPLVPTAPIATGVGGQSAGVVRSSAPPEKTWRWIAITGFEGDRVQVAGLVEGRVVTVPIAEIEAHWLETGIIVWESFEKTPPLLAEGAQGKSVIRLQSALSELRYFTTPVTGLYDETTLSAVAAFQRERGLVADGVAGPLTQIALYGRLSRYPVPRLSSGAAAPRRNGERG